MTKFSVFRKYRIEADDKKAAKKIWQGACANEQEEDFLTYEGLPKEEEERTHSFKDEVKRQVTGQY